MAENKGFKVGSGDIEIIIYEHIGVLEKRDNGWSLECNLVSWNGGAAKIDIREWSPDHARMSRGLAMSEMQAEKLARALADRYRQRSAKSRTAPPEKDVLER